MDKSVLRNFHTLMEVKIMAKRLLTDSLIKINNIHEEIRYIEDSDGYYISENGNVYAYYGNDNFFPKKNQIKQGYYYCDIKYND